MLRFLRHGLFSARFRASWRYVLLCALCAAFGGLLVPSAALGAETAAPFPNEWLGIRAAAATGVLATCALGGASSTARSVSAWVAATGTHFLDIIQIGAMVTPAGYRYFAAWGRGEPTLAGSSYEQRDLGPADGKSHKYAARLIGHTWSLSIDGRVKLTVDDSFRNWPVREVQVMNESEGQGDRVGGTAASPVRCAGARIHIEGWSTATWRFVGFGASAASALTKQGPDWFSAWRAS